MNKMVILISVLCGLLLCSNAYLLYVNHGLVELQQANEAAQLPTIGTPIKPIEVHGVKGAGHALAFGTNVNHDHLLLVMSPVCPYCQKNWPMWDKLMQRVPSNVDVTYFDVTGKFDKKLSEAHGIKEQQLITAPLDSAIKAHIVGTPTTILIAGNGKVRHVWEGVLDNKQLLEIVDMAQTDGAQELKTAAP